MLDSAFLMTWGDAFLPIDFSDVWRYFEGVSEPVLMTVYKNQHQRGPSNVDFNGKKVVRYDKQAGLRKDPSLNYIDYGLSAFRKSFIEQAIPPGASDLADTLKLASERGEIAGYEVTTPFFEIGSPEGLKAFADAMGLTFNSKFRQS
jgi:NDP-sugar pyrophosphorylase family protein